MCITVQLYHIPPYAPHVTSNHVLRRQRINLPHDEVRPRLHVGAMLCKTNAAGKASAIVRGPFEGGVTLKGARVRKLFARYGRSPSPDPSPVMSLPPSSTDSQIGQCTGYFEGLVVSYESLGCQVFTVRYTDGDEQRMSLDQLQRVLVK